MEPLKAPVVPGTLGCCLQCFDTLTDALTCHRPQVTMKTQNGMAVPVIACVDGMLYSEL